MDARARILEAAVECLGRGGYAGTTITAVARLAGLSRPSVYAHFGTREQLVSQALRQEAGEVVERVTAQARRASTAADFVVEATIAVRAEFRSRPALAPLAFPERSSPSLGHEAIGPEAMAMARAVLTPLLEYEPSLAEEIDEIAETLIRWTLSLAMFESDLSASDERLRAYLHRRLVPALAPRAAP